MATFTAYYNFALPTVGSDKNVWGQLLNQNWISLDTLLQTASTQAAAALPIAGGTMTGFITLNANPTAVLHPATKQYVDAADTALSTRVTAAQTRADNAFTNAATAQNTADAKVPTAGDAIKTGALTVTGKVTAQAGLDVVSGTSPMTINVGSASKVYGSITELGLWNSAGTIGARVNLTSGDFTASGNVIAYSDARLKENVVQIRDALALVNRMRGVFYDRVDTGAAGVGVIAQEMEEVLPAVVNDNGGTLGVAYGNLTAVLIEAVKELSARLDALEAR